MAYQSKNGQSYTNRSAMMRHDRIHGAANQQTSNMSGNPTKDRYRTGEEQQSMHGEHEQSVTIHKRKGDDGNDMFHVEAEGHDPKEHHDMESAMHHAKQIFGGHSGSDDVAHEAEGEDGMMM